MAKNLFKYGEIPHMDERVVISPPFQPEVSEELVEDSGLPAVREVYDGPSIEQLREEADDFIRDFEIQKEKMSEEAQLEIAQQLSQANAQAQSVLNEANETAAKVLAEADEKGKKLIADARKTAKEEKTQIESEAKQIEQQAKEKGYSEGRDEGYKEGLKEVDRLISKMHAMVAAVAERRKEILEESESQIVDLVLEISKKVVKTISETQKEVVVSNIKSALSKLKSKTDLIIRVNLSDVEMTTEHIEEFIKKCEKIKNITVLEDITVDRGGCIVETDFGHIDGRISSQLREIETRIRELSPMKQGG